MKCQQCGHSNPDSNRFCGMCGEKLEAARPSVAPRVFKTVPVSDDDLLEIGTPATRSEERSNLQSATAERIGALDEQRELVRDRAARNPGNGRRTTSSAFAEHVAPLTTPEEEAEEEFERLSGNTNYSTGIGGPSFLGIGYDSGGSNRGFVYDTPNGPEYEGSQNTPEYLLDEQPSRTVSWRAWALFAILLVGGALAYI